MARWTRRVGIFTAALVAVGIVTGVVFWRQLGVMQSQLDVMETDKRPWIRATVSLADPVIIREWGGSKGIKGIGLNLSFSLRNFGSAPAVNIRLGPGIAVHPGNPRRAELGTVEDDACAQTRNEAIDNRIGGFAIFPDSEEMIKTVPVSINGNPLFSDNNRQLFAVLGCIDYSCGAARYGQTGYRFLLGENVSNRVLGVLFRQGTPHLYEEAPSPELLKQGFPAAPPNEMRLSPSQFVFREEDSGNYAK